MEPRPGMYDDFKWKKLDERIQEAAAVLGYNEPLWDDSASPELTYYFWSQLDSTQQDAATALGYDIDGWNSDILALYEDEEYDELFWNELAIELRQLLVILGYNQNLWDQDEETSTTYVFWSRLSALQRSTALKLGFDAESWDEAVYDELWPGQFDDNLWAEMPVEVRAEFVVLGWNGNLWNSGGSASTSTKLWDQLTEAEREAAYNLGYGVLSWNREVLKNKA